ncbi:nose resistant to fluoxetine protein 6-like [Armigeres subalbatus]|uniref:nose resistant to fluoxetine protein 6-like n=1 Tax=Armigeres subalbatus TaxID=124917 RepID=UPI002ED1322C
MSLKCKLLCVLLVLLVSRWSSVYGSSASEIVPPIYRYDDFEKCQQVNSPGVFCYVRIVLESDADPIDTPSRIVTRFRRNQLDWGICVADCQREVALLDASARQRLLQPKIDVNFTHIFRLKHTRHKLQEYNAKYSQLINICVNNRLELDYHTPQHGYSEIEHCLTNDPLEARSDFDWLSVGFIAIVVALVIAVVAANVLEWLGDVQIKDHIVVSSFSLHRNWTRFTEVNKSEVYKDFGYVDGLRVFINIYVLMIHCLLVCVVLPVTNPESAERLLESRFMLNFTSTAPISVQTFFVISGMLLMVNFLKDVERKPQFSVEYFRTKITNRWIRLLPVYYFFLLMAAVGHALPGLKLGALGYSSLVVERSVCRERGWENVLFVNNLPISNERCFLHGWYMGADQQLFLGAMAVLALIWKFPKHTLAILTTLLVVANIVTLSIIYKLELEPVMPIRYSDLKFLLSYQPWFSHIYMPPYTNANGFISGLIVGYLYHETKRRRLNLKDSKIYMILRKITTPLVAVGFLSPFLFYEYDFRRSSWTVLLHSIVYRNYGALAGCMCFIYCFKAQPGFFRRFLASRPMTSLGKLSYSVYVLHVPLVRIMLNYVPALPEVSLPHIASLLLSLIVLSYAFGLVVYLFLEQPMSLLLKYWILERPSGKIKKTT